MALLVAIAYQPSEAPTLVDPSAGTLVTILTWNMEGSHRAATADLADLVDEYRPDIVVVEEAGPWVEGALPLDYTVMAHPKAATPPGVGLATRLPISAHGVLSQPQDARDVPRAYWLRLELDGAGEMTLLGTHLSVPFMGSSSPCPYCPNLRDAQVEAISDYARDETAAGRPITMAGEFNMTDGEVAYDGLSLLTDAGVGLGPDLATGGPQSAASPPPPRLRVRERRRRRGRRSPALRDHQQRPLSSDRAVDDRTRGRRRGDPAERIGGPTTP